MNELDQYVRMTPQQRHAYNAQKIGQAAKKRALAHLDTPDEPISNMPAGGTLSPQGDIGELGGIEAIKVFPALKKMKSRIMKASEYLPSKGL